MVRAKTLAARGLENLSPASGRKVALAGRKAPSELRTGKVRRQFDGATFFAADIDEYLGAPSGSRLDVFFFHPTRQNAREQLSQTAYPLSRLGDLVRIDGTAVTPASEYGDTPVRWIGLGDIEAQTGRFEIRETSGDRIKSNAHLFAAGEVLFSRLRPKLRGIGRPRVGIDEVRNLALRLPPLPTQRRLLRELLKADREADRLRAEAKRKLEAAVQRADDAFERVIGELCPDGQPRAASSSVGVGSRVVPSAARRTASA